MRLREYMVGVILAAVLIACSAANTPAHDAGHGLVATATLASGAAADSSGLVATATVVSGEQAATDAGLVATATVVSGEQATEGSGLVATATVVGVATVGQSIAVSGPVTAIHSASVFELDDVAQGGVLVLVPTGSFNVGQGQQVQVSGVMQQFDVAQLEQSLGTDIDDELAASLAGRPVVIAEQIDATVAGP